MQSDLGHANNEPTSTPADPTQRLSIVLGIVAGALAAWWSLGYLAVEADVRQLDLTQRAARFAIYQSAEQIAIGYALGLGAVGLLALRRWAPILTYLGSLTLSALVGWFYPIVTRESLAMPAVVLVGLVATMQVTKYWIPLAFAAAGALTVAIIPWFEIDKQLHYVVDDLALGPWLQLGLAMVALVTAIGIGLWRRPGHTADERLSELMSQSDGE